MSRTMCDVDGCGYPRNAWCKYCKKHDQRNQRTGDPRGNTVKRSELHKHRAAVEEMLGRNPSHPNIEQALAWLRHRLENAHQRRVQRTMPAAFRVENLFHRLHQRGVTAQDVLSTVCALWLLRESVPERFVSDRHFWHQLGKAVHALAPFRRPDGSMPHNNAVDLTVGARERLAADLREALGALPLRIARHIHESRPRSYGGVKAPPAVRGAAPFSTSTQQETA